MATIAVEKNRTLVVVLDGDIPLFQWAAVAMCECAKKRAGMGF
jgi:hypothetical protein